MGDDLETGHPALPTLPAPLPGTDWALERAGLSQHLKVSGLQLKNYQNTEEPDFSLAYAPMSHSIPKALKETAQACSRGGKTE